MSRTPSASGGVGAGPSLLLVGHGSHLSADSSRPVHDLARRLRGGGTFSEVRVAFWKEEPFLPHALDLVEGDEVFVVPVFTSVGYFTDRVVPRELGAHRPDGSSGGPRVRTCAPIGTHPGISRVVLERAREGAPLPRDREGDAALVLIGHGTELHPESADTTRAVAARVAESGPYGTVLPAFLDQAPRLRDVLEGIDETDVILVPFFVSEGWHTRSTIPAQLGLEGRKTEKAGVTLWYTEAVGTHPAMAEVVRDLVRDEIGRAADEGDAPYPHAPGQNAPGPDVRAAEGARPKGGERGVHRARRDLEERLSRVGDAPFLVMEAAVHRIGPERFELRHRADVGLASESLRSLGSSEDLVPIVLVSRDGGHRPLRSAPDLQRGWRLTGLSPRGVWEAFGLLYPGVLLHRRLSAEGTLSVTEYPEFAARQTGMYEGVDRLSPAALAAVARRTCGSSHCLRTPLWGAEVDPIAEVVPGADGGREAATPCPVPCALLLSRAREASRAERGEPADDPDG